MIENNTLYDWILQTTFTVSAREKSVQHWAPYLSDLVQPGVSVLDLCCGSGPASFWFEAQGARVAGVDFAPYMIALAREEVLRRSSSVQFIEADIFAYDFGQKRYDFISCFGNSISDFPLVDFARMVKLVSKALKPGGRFVLEYHDGSYKYMQGYVIRQGTYQETPEKVTFRYKEYLPEVGACINTMRNETRGEEYSRKSYIYTIPVVQLIAGNELELEQHVVLEENHFLDIFRQEQAKIPDYAL